MFQELHSWDSPHASSVFFKELFRLCAKERTGLFVSDVLLTSDCNYICLNNRDGDMRPWDGIGKLNLTFERKIKCGCLFSETLHSSRRKNLVWHSWISEMLTLQSCPYTLKSLQLVCVCVLVLFAEPVTHLFHCERSRTHLLQSAFNKKKKWQKKVMVWMPVMAVFFFLFFYRNRMFSSWKKITGTAPKAYKRCLHFLSWLNRWRLVLNSLLHCGAQVGDSNNRHQDMAVWLK